MPATARERARAATIADITAEGRRQLARDGAAALSLRSIARELEMVSSGIYRYVASRDELLTLLIIDAYDHLADAIERARRAAGPAPRDRWRVAAGAVRAWAQQHPHEYALVYGSPVPGYAAPQDTVAHATRVYAALAEPRRAEQPAGRLAEIGLDVDDATADVVLRAWMQLFGMVSFELFGHTVGVVDDHDAFFAAGVEELADRLGI